MPDIMLHDVSKRQLQSLRTRLPHAVLLSGPIGIGLATIAHDIASQLAMEEILVLPERQEVVDVEKGTITVQSIRRLYDIAKTKGKPRLIIIDYAERMGTTAQNAFLKLLEEPNEATHFILLSHTPQTLLPTILSRVQKVELRKVTRQQSEDLLGSLGVTDREKQAQLLFMAEGLPAELIRLQDEVYFSQRAQIVKDARTFITGRPYERTVVAHRYKESRPNALLLLGDVLRLLSLTVNAKHDRALLKKIDAAMEAYGRVEANGNIRLQLATVFS